MVPCEHTTACSCPPPWPTPAVWHLSVLWEDGYGGKDSCSCPSVRGAFSKMIKPFFLATNRRLACCSLSSLPWVMYPSSVAMIPCCRVGTFHKISQSLNNYSLLRSKSHRRGIYIIMLFKGPHFKLGSWAVLFLGLQRSEIAACFWLPRLALWEKPAFWSLYFSGTKLYEVVV